MTRDIQAALDRLGTAFPRGTADKLGTLVDELEKWNRKVNLTAIRDREEMITGHLLDSLIVARLVEGKTVLDVGTGAGFPGLPLAIVQPERRYTLLDSNRKKIMFVQHVAGMLGLENVSAEQARAEDYAPGHGFDTVIARALAALPRLVEMAGHHVGENGVFVAMKGRYPDEELDDLEVQELPWTHVVTALDVPGLEAGSRHAVLLRPKSPNKAGSNDANHSRS